MSAESTRLLHEYRRLEEEYKALQQEYISVGSYRPGEDIRGPKRALTEEGLEALESLRLRRNAAEAAWLKALHGA